MRAPTPWLKNLLARGLLALVLLFVQQQAVLHWLSHAIEATHAKAGGGSTQAEHCDECLGLSALGAGATSACAAPPASVAQHALVTLRFAATAPAALRLAFRSRAPPTLI